MEITKLGIDLAKSSFHVCGKNTENKIVFSKKMSAGKLRKLLVDLNPCAVFMESCAGANYWGRFAEDHGHSAHLIAPQHVKPYVTSGQKNDHNDALAILEAAARPSQYFQKPKSKFCQDLQALLRSREFIIAAKVALTNHVRAVFLEYGIEVRIGDIHLKAQMVEMLSTLEVNYGFWHQQLMVFQDMYSLLLVYEKNIKELTEKIETHSNQNAVTKRLQQVPGIGPMSAAWFLAFIGDGSQFKNGRQASACLGLVPRQNSTGGKRRLFGITKRGNVSVRTTLIHGARSYVRAVQLKGVRSSHDEWVYKLLETKGSNKTAVAVANKNTRILWSMIKNGTEFKTT